MRVCSLVMGWFQTFVFTYATSFICFPLLNISQYFRKEVLIYKEVTALFWHYFRFFCD